MPTGIPVRPTTLVAPAAPSPGLPTGIPARAAKLRARPTTPVAPAAPSPGLPTGPPDLPTGIPARAAKLRARPTTLVAPVHYDAMVETLIKESFHPIIKNYTKEVTEDDLRKIYAELSD
ncbi:MAG: hypothetical protein FWD31_04470 [Planctomycetaceae bacterium]|nr:hypothetical protein [Planctomycetaceae bacterium]